MPLTAARLNALIKDEFDAMSEYTALAAVDPRFLEMAQDEHKHYTYLLDMQAKLKL